MGSHNEVVVKSAVGVRLLDSLNCNARIIAVSLDLNQLHLGEFRGHSYFVIAELNELALKSEGLLTLVQLHLDLEGLGEVFTYPARLNHQVHSV